MHNADTPLESVENEQKKLKEELGYIKQVNLKIYQKNNKIQ